MTNDRFHAENVVELSWVEEEYVDRAPIAELMAEQGIAGAELQLGARMISLAHALAEADAAWHTGRVTALADSAEQVRHLARTVGLQRLARVSGDVARTARGGCGTALAATVARMLRVADCGPFDLRALA